MDAQQHNESGDDAAAVRTRCADVARLLVSGPSEGAHAEQLRSELNKLDRGIDAGRTRDRRAQVESLLALENANTMHVPFDELPEYVASLEHLQQRASRRLAGQKPGGFFHQRTHVELQRLDTELAYYRAVANDRDLYEELVVAKRTRSHAPGKKPSPVTLWAGLVCTIVGGLLLIPTALIGGVMGVAGSIGQVVSGVFLLGLILLVVGVRDGRRS